MRKLAALRRCRSAEGVRRSVPRRAQVDTRAPVTGVAPPTKSRQNVDASLTTRGPPSRTLTSMSNPPLHDHRIARRLARPRRGARTRARRVRHPRAEAVGRRAEPLRRGDASSARARSRVVGRLRRSRPVATSSAAPRSENRDVKIAAERVRAARAGETISRSWLFPSVGVGGGALRPQDRTTTATSRTSSPRPPTRRCAGRARASRGKSTSSVACARAPPRPPRTRWRPRTPRAAFACWC